MTQQPQQPEPYRPTVADFFAQPTEPDEDQSVDDVHQATARTFVASAAFNAASGQQPTEPDKIARAFAAGPGMVWQVPPDPLERIAAALESLTERITGMPRDMGEAVKKHAKPIGGTPSYTEIEDMLRATREQFDDKLDELGVTIDVIADVEAALGKSKAAPALAAKAVIDEWRKGPAEAPTEPGELPVTLQDGETVTIPGEPVTVTEPNEQKSPLDPTHADGRATTYPGDPVTVTQAEVPPGAVNLDAQLTAEFRHEPPAHDASVTDWRSYARRVHGVPAGEASVFDTMNRSQVRTALGIAQPVEGGA